MKLAKVSQRIYRVFSMVVILQCKGDPGKTHRIRESGRYGENGRERLPSEMRILSEQQVPPISWNARRRFPMINRSSRIVRSPRHRRDKSASDKSELFSLWVRNTHEGRGGCHDDIFNSSVGERCLKYSCRVWYVLFRLYITGVVFPLVLPSASSSHTITVT